MGFSRSHLLDAVTDQRLQNLTTEIMIEVNALVIYNQTTYKTAPNEDEHTEKGLFSALFAWVAQTGAFIESLIVKERFYQAETRNDFVKYLTVFGKASEVRSFFLI